MRLLISLITFLLLSTAAYAAAPVIYYSDLTSGPNSGGQSNNGVFVTIWGNNFGGSQGGSSVTVGGGAVASYQLWSNTEIIFQLGSSAATGNIVVTTGGGTSNGIPFTVRSGNIYFVDPTQGSNGSGTYASPFNHMWYAFNVQSAGDTVYIRAGSITDEIDGCAGWHSILCQNKSGSSGSPVAWVSYPNETVTLTADGAAPTWSQGSSGAGGESQTAYIFRSNGGSYITVAKLNLRFTGTSGNLQEPIATGCGWRVVGNDLSMNVFTYGGIDLGSGSCAIKVLGNTIHDSGAGYGSTQNQSHSIYIDGPNNPFEVGWNYMYNNTKIGWEISNYHNGPRIGTIHDNLIIASSGAGTIKGILVDGAADLPTPDTASTLYTNAVSAYNNVIINAGQTSYGGAMQTTCGTNKIYNNTIYGSGTEGKGVVQFVEYSCGPSGGNQVAYFANNIIYGNNSGKYISDSNGNDPANWSDFTVLADNNYYGEGNGPTQDTTAINADPKFVSPAYDTTANLQLQSSSPDLAPAGYNTSATVPTDYNGVTSSSSMWIGAYSGTTSGGGGGTSYSFNQIIGGNTIIGGQDIY